MKKLIKKLLPVLLLCLGQYTFAQISTNPYDYLFRVKNDFGYLYGGPNDSLRSYLMTDLPSIFINKPLLVNRIGSLSGNLNLLTDNANRITVADSTGNVGIGISNPQSKLHVTGEIRSYPDSLSSNYLAFKHDGIRGFINTVGPGGIQFQNNGVNSVFIDNIGRVAVGNIYKFPTGFGMYVEKGIIAERIRVAVQSSNDWSDYVFADDYALKPLPEVEQFVKTNKHLPNVPNAETMVNNGLNVAEMDAKLLEKIEEAFLYIIELDKKVNALQLENKQLKNKLKHH